MVFDRCFLVGEGRVPAPRDATAQDGGGGGDARSAPRCTASSTSVGRLRAHGADGPRSEGGRKILRDNSRVYVRFLPLVRGRVHLGRLNKYSSILGAPLEPRESAFPRPRVYSKMIHKPKPASISDATIQMDHNAVVLFTIDRLARSPRTTVRTRGTELAPDRCFIK